MQIMYTIIIVAVLVLLVILPLFIKVIILNQSLRSMNRKQKDLAIKYDKSIKDRKRWEEELGLIIKQLFGDKATGFNIDLYIGTLLAYQRGYRITGLEEWLNNPTKDSDIYRGIFDLFMEEIPKRDKLIGYNTFDNMARILIESQEEIKYYK